MTGVTLKQRLDAVLEGYRRGAELVLMVLGATLLGLYYYEQQPWALTFSETPSLDPGLYRYKRDDVFNLSVGQAVLYRYTAPEWVRERNWDHKPPVELQLKRIAGMPGDRVEVRGREVYVCPRSGMPCDLVAKRTEFDRTGRPWPAPGFEGTIPNDHYFVVGVHPLSFDSRYFGPIARPSILGRAVPVYVQPLPASVFTTDWDSVLRQEVAGGVGVAAHQLDQKQ